MPRVEESLRTQIEQRIEVSGAEVAVAFEDLQTGEEVLINADEVFHAASTMKVPVLVELFHQAQIGELELDERTTIRNEFKSLLDGSPFTTEAEDDGEKTFYERLGEGASLVELAEPMITYSSNLATNILVERLNAENVTRYMAEIGLPTLTVRRGVMDLKAFDAHLNNEVTARDLKTLAAMLARREVVSSEASEAIIKIMLKQTIRSSIPAKLPPEVQVANKTGSFTRHCHDFGIVFVPGRRPYALAVLTRGLDDHDTAAALIADTSRDIYDWVAG